MHPEENLNELMQRKQRQQEAFIAACLALDEMNLGWDEEWEQAALADWEVSDEQS